MDIELKQIEDVLRKGSILIQLFVFVYNLQFVVF